MRLKPFSRNAFTLLELMIVLALIAVLLSLILPAIMSARQSALDMVCKNNLSQMGRATHAFFDDQKGFPQASYVSPHYYLLEYLDLPSSEDVAAERKKFHQIFVCPRALGTLSHSVVFGRPVESPVAPTSYGVSHGVFDRPNGSGYGSFGSIAPKIQAKHFSDGLAHTVMLTEIIPSQDGSDWKYWTRIMADPKRSWSQNYIECYRQDRNWTKAEHEPMVGLPWTEMSTQQVYHNQPPGSASCFITESTERERGFVSSDSYHEGGVHILLLDGSVQFVTRSIDLAIWRALGTAAAGDSPSGAF